MVTFIHVTCNTASMNGTVYLFKQPCCLPTVILTLVIMLVLGEPHFFSEVVPGWKVWEILFFSMSFQSIPWNATQRAFKHAISISNTYWDGWKRLVSGPVVWIQMTNSRSASINLKGLKTVIPCLCVCFQDASHPGPSPSSAGVPLPPKVASITSELLAHAKVQLPLNMWVHLRVPSAHPPVTWGDGRRGGEPQPQPPALRSVFQIQDLQSYVLAPLKNVFIPSFVPRVFWPSSTTFATTFTPPLAKDEIPIREEEKIQLHSFP